MTWEKYIFCSKIPSFLNLGQTHWRLVFFHTPCHICGLALNTHPRLDLVPQALMLGIVQVTTVWVNARYREI